ncbi:MAG: hypothetical protein F6K40_12520 [Okeania sp. SIO3I5]|uniref:hypothetical protein n=1 Tax=Okeania sp. SIO3I5 TaxID=2607805 RepID=UPI0013BC1AC9|nr:hypothetical protein [Okeania sp. SIO3I5]NEQ37054.1 hypothetical protein [Okeania sp. SIO3I5]
MNYKSKILLFKQKTSEQKKIDNEGENSSQKLEELKDMYNDMRSDLKGKSRKLSFWQSSLLLPTILIFVVTFGLQILKTIINIKRIETTQELGREIYTPKILLILASIKQAIA